MARVRRLRWNPVGADGGHVRDYSLVTRAPEEYLLELEIADRILRPRDGIHRFDGTIGEEYGRGRAWTLEVRFPGRTPLSKAAALLAEYDVDVNFESTPTYKPRPSRPSAASPTTSTRRSRSVSAEAQ